MNILFISSVYSKSLKYILKEIINSDIKTKHNFYVALYNPLNNITIKKIYKIIKKNRFLYLVKKLYNYLFQKDNDSNLKTAQKLSYKLLELDNINSDSFVKTLKDANINIIFIYDFGQILKDKVINSVNMVINIHNSLLPAYRGQDPVYWVLRNKEKKTGITYHYIIDKIDAGDIIYQIETNIEERMNEESLKERLYQLAGESIIRVIEDIINSKIKAISQDETMASYYSNKKKIYG